MRMVSIPTVTKLDGFDATYGNGLVAEARCVVICRRDHAAVANDDVIASEGIHGVTIAATNEDVVTTTGVNVVIAAICRRRGTGDDINIAEVSIADDVIDQAVIADDDVITLVAVDDVTLVTADHDVVIGVTVEGIDRAEAFPRGFDALDQRGGPDTVGRFSLGNHTVVAEHNVISGVAVQGVSARCRRGQHAEHRGDIGRIDQCSDLVLREQQQVDIEGSVAVDMIVARLRRGMVSPPLPPAR